MTATAVATRISLGLGCSEACDKFGGPLFLQMSSGRYDLCSVLPLGPLEDWRAEHRTARKRADRCERRGYRFSVIQRHTRAAEIHAINTSAPERQGRPMSNGYHEWPSEYPLPRYACERHAIRTYGVEHENGTLVAYLWMYRAGDLALVSQILGHASHLENEVMYLLMQGALGFEHMVAPTGFCLYNRHDSGTDGLRFFKERVGFTEQPVEWLP